MRSYLSVNAEAWQKWINHFKQKKTLVNFIDLIPVPIVATSNQQMQQASPIQKMKLPAQVYTDILTHLIKQKSFEEYLGFYEALPSFLVDHESLIKDMEIMLKADNELRGINFVNKILFELNKIIGKHEKALAYAV